MEAENQKEWAIVELFGHTKMAGEVSTQTLGGASFIRVDAPETKSKPAYTRTLNPSAIYALNWCTEDVARAAAETHNPQPVTSWDLRKAVNKAIEAETAAQLEGPKTERRERSEWADNGDDDIPFG